MEPSIRKFAQKLTYFLSDKHFSITNKACRKNLRKEYSNYLSSMDLENIGIAVYMLSYTFRVKCQTSFANVCYKLKSEKDIIAYILKFVQIYFKKPSHFKILMICSSISEMLLCMFYDDCLFLYETRLVDILLLVLRVVCFDYLCTNGGWKAVDEVAKKVTEGYKVLKPIIDVEHPDDLTDIGRTLQSEAARKDHPSKKKIRNTEHEQNENFENYFSFVDVDERVSVGNFKSTSDKKSYELTDNSACNGISSLPCHSSYEVEYIHLEPGEEIIISLEELPISANDQNPNQYSELTDETKEITEKEISSEQQNKEPFQSDSSSIQKNCLSTKVPIEPYVPEMVVPGKKKHKTKKQKKKGKRK